MPTETQKRNALIQARRRWEDMTREQLHARPEKIEAFLNVAAEHYEDDYWEEYVVDWAEELGLTIISYGRKYAVAAAGNHTGFEWDTDTETPDKNEGGEQNELRVVRFRKKK